MATFLTRDGGEAAIDDGVAVVVFAFIFVDRPFRSRIDAIVGFCYVSISFRLG
ncbi:MAG TPA: hypothetical protein VHX49_05050 [Candidatus Acidoferrales bacterium]|nr:hypothetical protein [Candidatus Acidoferrales bacterium]